MVELAFSSAAQRNRGPILEVLERILPVGGRVLEIASGSGQHVTFFASQLPRMQWLPSELDGDMRDTIQQRVTAAALSNVAPSLHLDVLDPWPDLEVDAVIVANLLHISPATTLPALCQGAANVCAAGGILHIYGPFKCGGEHNSAGNTQFDASLRATNPAWGIRDLEQVVAAASRQGFDLIEQTSMPANNYSLAFRLTAQ